MRHFHAQVEVRDPQGRTLTRCLGGVFGRVEGGDYPGVGARKIGIWGACMSRIKSSSRIREKEIVFALCAFADVNTARVSALSALPTRRVFAR